MISIVLPLSPNLDLTRATLTSLEIALEGNPFEVLFVNREDGVFSKDLIKTGDYSLVTTQESDFGLQLNEASGNVSKQSSVILFATPGNIFFHIPYNELIEASGKNPFDVTAFRVGRLNNPNTERVQIFPSWFGMATSSYAFRQLSGFSKYLPLVGGDLLYSLEAIKRGGNLQRLNSSCRELKEFQVSDPDILSVHNKLLLKRLPMIMSSKGLRGDVMEGWPGVRLK